MKKQRFIKGPPFGSKPGRCGWCGTTDLPKGRTKWCSRKCVDAYLVLRSPADVRRMLHQRDGGICAICGCDADAAYRAWQQQRKEVRRMADRLMRWDRHKYEYRERQEFCDRLVAKYVPGAWTSGRRSGWDCDHIIPVVEGGGQCGLDNYRTLCHPCHKAETAALARRRAEARQEAAQLPLFDFQSPPGE